MNIFENFRSNMQKINNLRDCQDPEVIRDAYENGNWEVISSIASNPFTPEDILNEISENANKNLNPITESLIKNKKCTDTVKINLSQTKDLLLILKLLDLPLPSIAYDNIINNYPKGKSKTNDAFIYALSKIPVSILLKHTQRQDWKKDLIFEALKMKNDNKKDGIVK